MESSITFEFHSTIYIMCPLKDCCLIMERRFVHHNDAESYAMLAGAYVPGETTYARQVKG
jgi:hypothetical protein